MHASNSIDAFMCLVARFPASSAYPYVLTYCTICFQVEGEPDDEVHTELGRGGELLAGVEKEVGARKPESQKVRQ